MQLTLLDALVFGLFMATVVTVSILAGRRKASGEDYFLAGRGLTWPFIGFSLIAANISTEHFVGMAGTGFGTVGLAIASYEWIAAITLVFVAWWLLPRFLRAGIYTMPEFLEYRYDQGTRAIMAGYMLVIYIVVLLAAVLYSGAQAVNAIFDIRGLFESRFGLAPADAEFWAVVSIMWVIGILGATYTIYGGLKAVVWADLIQGSGLLLTGLITFVLALRLIGGEVTPDGERIAGGIIEGWQRFTSSEQTASKLHMVLPASHPELPWTAIVLGGIWIPNLFYWGLNQFITQRTLAARSLAEGQKGILFAAVLKLTIPFIIVMPGIMAYQLFGDELTAQARRAHLQNRAQVTTVTEGVTPDALSPEDEAKILEKAGEKAFPTMMSRIVPAWMRGFMFAALCGAVISTFNSGLNSSSTIFTMDIYRKYINPNAPPRQEVVVGRIATGVVVVVACLWAPIILKFEHGVFKYIQMVWGFVSPGIVAVFVVGLVVAKTPPAAAKWALVLGVPLYGFFRFGQHLWGTPVPGEALTGLRAVVASFNNWPFLHHMMLMFVILSAFMLIVTAIRPLDRPVSLPQSKIDTTAHPRVYVFGCLIIAATVALYIKFW
ncbi:MAG TPA: solute:sodium symporter family transporter [Phycisphaerae bacterium]|nr:solute:sodium symporter family transporter [Phycisphaerae bacterium]